MPLIHEVKPACRHDMPDVYKYGLGTIYACDKCSAKAVLEEDYKGRYWHFSHIPTYSRGTYEF